MRREVAGLCWDFAPTENLAAIPETYARRETPKQVSQIIADRLVERIKRKRVR